MFRRPHYLAMAIVLLVVLMVLNLPTRTAQQFKLAISELFLPLFGLANSTHTLVGKAGEAIVPRRELLRKINQLETENRRLKLQISENHADWVENQNFRKLFGFQPRAPGFVKAAQVIGSDTANWWRTMTISLGARDNVSTNYSILSAEGFLVGRVSAVSYARSEVVLLGDPNCQVAAVVETTRHHGMISAQANPSDTSVVDLLYLPRQTELKAGQNVLTSGHGGIFPPGILIGKIIDSQKVGGLYTTARVRLAADLNRLEEVWVKFP